MTDNTETLIARLRWLANARTSHPSSNATVEAGAALALANILEGADDGYSWVPSGLWADWEAQTADDTGATLHDRHLAATQNGKNKWVYGVALYQVRDGVTSWPSDDTGVTYEEAQQLKNDWLAQVGEEVAIVSPIIVRRQESQTIWTVYDTPGLP